VEIPQFAAEHDICLPQT